MIRAHFVVLSLSFVISGCTDGGDGASASATGTTAGDPSGDPQEPDWGDVRGVWASSAEDLWAVTDRGVIAHYDGSGWQFPELPRQTPFNAVHGSAPDHVVAVGNSDLVLVWDGAAWQELGGPFPGNQDIWSVWTAGPTEIWVGGDSVARFDGAAWSYPFDGMAQPERVHAIWGSGPDDVWIKGEFHWDGAAITTDGAAPYALADLHGAGPNHVTGITGGSYLRWDGAAWIEEKAEQLEGGGIWVASESRAYAVSGNELRRWDGDGWSLAGALTDAPNLQLYDLWGLGADDVVVAGGGGSVARWRGDGFTILH